MKAKSINFYECEFKKTNWYNQNWVLRLEESDLIEKNGNEFNKEKTQANIETYFGVISIGANAFLSSFNIKIEDSKFQ